MPGDQFIQCLFLISQEGEQMQVRKSQRSLMSSSASVPSAAKAYVLLPEVFRNESHDLLNLFRRNDIHVLTNDTPLPPFQHKLQIIDILFEESPISSTNPLWVYEAFDYKEVIQLLLSNTTVRFKSVPIEGKLCPAVDDKNINVMKHLLNHGVEIQCRHGSQESILHLAAETGPVSLVSLILEHGVDVNVTRSDGTTPLHMAVLYGLAPIVWLLIRSGANVDSKFDKDFTALDIAIFIGCNEVVEILLRNGANVNVEEDSRTGSPLHVAVKKGNLDLLELLVKYGALENATDVFNAVLLMTAVLQKHSHVLQYLLEGAFWNRQGSQELRSLLVKLPDIIRSSNPPFSSVDVKHFFDILLCHAVKYFTSKQRRLFQGMDDFNPEFLTYIVDGSSNFSDYVVKCELEVTSMMRQTIGDTNVSFHNVLDKEEYVVAGYLRNESIARIASSDEVNDKFPIFASILMHCFQKGMQRKSLLEAGIKICGYLFSDFKQLPYELKEKILNYLTNRDILILENVCGHLKASP